MSDSNHKESGKKLANNLAQGEPELSWPYFESRIINSKVNSVKLDWPLLIDATVYSIEKFHKRLGWLQVEWSTRSPVEVTNMEENFGYRLRIKALKVSEDGSRYVALAISPDIIVIIYIILHTYVSNNCIILTFRRARRQNCHQPIA